MRRFTIDAEMNAEMSQAEMLPDFWFGTRVDSWGDRAAISIIGLSEPYVVHLGDGSIEELPVGGVATFVR